MSGHANNAMRREWEISTRTSRREKGPGVSFSYKLGRVRLEQTLLAHHFITRRVPAAPWLLGGSWLRFFLGARLTHLRTREIAAAKAGECITDVNGMLREERDERETCAKGEEDQKSPAEKERAGDFHQFQSLDNFDGAGGLTLL
jgi:hypothetical protein